MYRSNGSVRPSGGRPATRQIRRVVATVALLLFAAGSLALGLALVNLLTVFLGGASWWPDPRRALGIASLAWLVSLVFLIAAIVAPAAWRLRQQRPRDE